MSVVIPLWPRLLPPAQHSCREDGARRLSRGEGEEAAQRGSGGVLQCKSTNTIQPTHPRPYSPSVMPLTKLEVTLLEVAKAHLRDGFLIAQPTLTRALKSIFVMKFGAADWLAQFKTYLGRSMAEHAVDDGRAFDM